MSVLATWTVACDFADAAGAACAETYVTDRARSETIARAEEVGWLFRRGKAYCPGHNPERVVGQLRARALL